MMNSVELMQLEGYLVANDGSINYPVLGAITVVKLSAAEIEKKMVKLLEDGDPLNNPSVSVRRLNSKFTVLGEVKQPGTYTYTEQNISLLQALGYAGDLTINGKRNDIIITRDVDGVRKIAHIDLTTTDFMTSEYYYIKPNDQIIVNQNNPRVMNSGYIGSTGTILTIASLLLSVAVLLSR
jgi:polysaccharide export outer membrane protein